MDYFNPVNNSVRSNNTFTETTAACGTGGAITNALAWSHASSARESHYKSLYIIAYRNLNTVVAYKVRVLAQRASPPPRAFSRWVA